MQRLVGGVAVMVAACALVGVPVAAAAAAPAGGPIGLFATVSNGPSGKVVVAGAIGDWGTVVSVDENGKTDENGNFVKVRLKKGTFELDATALNKKLANPRPQVASQVTCSIGFSGSGPLKLFNGTGLYTGISGTVDATVTFAGIGGRYESGAKKGQCERGNSTPLLAQFGSVVGRGTVQFT